MNNVNSKKALLKRIDVLKKELIEIGLKEGLNDPKTIKHSQELDKLINAYQNTKK